MDGSVRSWRYAPNASVNQSYLPHRWCAIFQPLCELTHIPTRLIFFFCQRSKKKNPPWKDWPNDLQLWIYHLTKYSILSCVGGFFFPLLLPRLSALSQWDVCHCLLHVLNLSFDDLLLTHGINLSVKLTELCETAKDLPIAFFFFVWQKKGTSERQRRKSRGLISNYLIYMKINPRASSTQRD